MSVGGILGSVADIIQKAADESLASGAITQAEHDALTASLLHPAMDEINATLGEAVEKLHMEAQDIVAPLLESLGGAGAEPAAPEAADPALEARLTEAMDSLRNLAEQNPAALDEVLRSVGEQAAAAETPAEAAGGFGGALGGVANALGEATGGALDGLTAGGLAEVVQPVFDQLGEIIPTTSISEILDVEVAEGELDEVVVEARADRASEIGELERLQQQANQMLTQAQAMATQLTDDSQDEDEAADEASSGADDADDDAPARADDAEPEDEPEPDPSELTE